MSGPMATVNRPLSRLILKLLVWYLLLLFATITVSLLYLTPRKPAVGVKDGRGRGQLDFPRGTKLTFEDVKDLHQEDHRLIRYMQTNVLNPPPVTDKYNGNATIERGGNTEHVMALFNNKKNGFFIESGANDGLFLSNTLPLEVLLNWTGLLVEPDPVPFGKLAENRRNAWTSHSCMSLEKYPTTVSMRRHKVSQGLSYIPPEEENLNEGKKEEWPGFNSTCFPFYSFLLAIGRTEIDSLALDVEESELGILSTIPWDKVFIKTITIEVHPKFVTPMRNYMESVGYMYIKVVKAHYTHDQLYIHPKALNELKTSVVVAYTK